MTDEKIMEALRRAGEQLNCRTVSDGGYQPNGGKPCGARCSIVQGRVHIIDGCSRPCGFYRERAYAVQKFTDAVIGFASILGVDG
jgi:hypothetical protein